MFAREPRRSKAEPLAHRRAEPERASVSRTPSLPVILRSVCPCGGGCPRCAEETKGLFLSEDVGSAWPDAHAAPESPRLQGLGDPRRLPALGNQATLRRFPATPPKL